MPVILVNYHEKVCMTLLFHLLKSAQCGAVFIGECATVVCDHVIKDFLNHRHTGDYASCMILNKIS